jgi:hypothetical protein
MPAVGLSWITSNAGVVKVTAEGALEGIAPGRAIITAQAPGGKPASLTVIVTGDLLVASSRGGRFGIYALVANSPQTFFPVLADSTTNYLDAVYSPDRADWSLPRIASAGGTTISSSPTPTAAIRCG